MSSSAEAGSGPVPLPRGRHGLSREEVRSSQEARIQRAMLASVAERGYAATTVPAVVTAARVSRSAFYALYKDKQECFFATCDGLGRDMLAEITRAFDPERWQATFEVGMRAYLRWWQERPEFARAYFLALPAIGEQGVDYRDRYYEPFRRMFAQLGRTARGGEPLPELVPRMLVLGITEIVAEEIRAGREDRLHELAPQLTEIVMALLERSPATGR